MKKERENISVKTKPLTKTPPKTSADTQTKLSPKDFSISGNDFTAYYDGAEKLVFVLDKTFDDRKPNVLLIINPIGDRKWDDILANDFGVDLETIRPKVDNKYQKLDIEYSGLAVYDKLINDYKKSADLTFALEDLSDFRNSSIKRAAADRLAASTEIIKKTRETISKTGETMRELQSRLKKLRDKLSKQKKQVGKEPTKQSAAKILKTESQIDATNAKLKRAMKRLKNAQRRMAVAEEDAEIARRILDKKDETRKEIKKEEPKAQEMSEEVKPLFDQDPKIMDQGIAFKPIDFSFTQKPLEQPALAPVIHTEPIVVKPVVAEIPSAPLSFVPPTIGQTLSPEPVIIPEQPKQVPVLETITPIPTPQPVVRPISPISGPEQIMIEHHKRPNALYYVLLVVLIVLSVFTLWMYQKRTVDTVPDLAKQSVQESISEQPKAVEEAPVVVQEANVESPFIQAEKAAPAEVAEPAPVEVEQPVVTEPQPAPAVINETAEASAPEVVIEPQQAPELPIQSDDSGNTMPPALPAEEPQQMMQPASAPEMGPRKPTYDVSGERRFVADENYQAPSPDSNYSE
ncbi:MAG TPA: hypothetical protein PKJ33_02175 [Alphaproteobacteria bacterium]|nr:hypothetical protein [Alphaproteobacteria bacterium]